VRIGIEYLRIVSPFMILVAYPIVLGRVLQAAGDALAPMIMTIACLWGLQVPLAWGLARPWGTAGVWWAMTITTVVHAAVMVGWVRRGSWKHRTV